MEDTRYLQARGLIGPDMKITADLGKFKVVKSGVIMQAQTTLGIPYDIAISWLQKSVRLGNYQDALFCAYLILELDTHPLNKSGTIQFRSHLLNRLITIMSEDIGMAENIVVFIAERYWKLWHHPEITGKKLSQTVAEMLYVLCNARKSRYTDWIIHICEFKLHDVIEDADDRIKDLVKLVEDLRLPIAETTVEIAELMNLFRKRGKKYGRLYQVHAAIIATFPEDLLPARSETELLDGFVFDYESYTSLKDYDYHIPDSAIDKHTFWGRQYLRRGLLYFTRYSAILNNWVPYREEMRYLDAIIAYVQPKLSPKFRDRPYQAKMQNNVATAIRNGNKNIGIFMATGTGKTRTSFEFMQQNTESGDLGLIVFPTIDILHQFLAVWMEMTQRLTIYGIYCSKFRKYSKSKYVNWEYIRNLDKFLAYPTELVGQRIIVTTYANLFEKANKILPQVKLAIYDEGHHVSKRMLSPGSNIILTATPAKIGSLTNVSYSYSMADGIADGFLVNFRVKMLPEEWDEQQIMDYISENQRKTIVYSINNKISKKLYSNVTVPEGHRKFYIDCNLPNRAYILKRFRKQERGTIFNCSLLCEGVDVPDCDSVYFHSGKTTSLTALIQCIGRCVRPSKGKTISTVYMQQDHKGNWKKRMNLLAKHGCDPDIIEVR